MNVAEMEMRIRLRLGRATSREFFGYGLDLIVDKENKAAVLIQSHSNAVN